MANNVHSLALALSLLPLVAGAVLAISACQAIEPASHPESTCMDACEKRTGACDEKQCRRGCRLALDRLVEREGDNVIACVAKGVKAKRVCDDDLWADCAARIGVHADGGPPAPVKPKEDDE